MRYASPASIDTTARMRSGAEKSGRWKRMRSSGVAIEAPPAKPSISAIWSVFSQVRTEHSTGSLLGAARYSAATDISLCRSRRAFRLMSRKRLTKSFDLVAVGRSLLVLLAIEREFGGRRAANRLQAAQLGKLLLAGGQKHLAAADRAVDAAGRHDGMDLGGLGGSGGCRGGLRS